MAAFVVIVLAIALGVALVPGRRGRRALVRALATLRPGRGAEIPAAYHAGGNAGISVAEREAQFALGAYGTVAVAVS
jgi:hypothetical protein